MFRVAGLKILGSYGEGGGWGGGGGGGGRGQTWLIFYNSNSFHFLFSKKMWVIIRVRIHKILQKQSELGLHCLSRPIR